MFIVAGDDNEKENILKCMHQIKESIVLRFINQTSIIQEEFSQLKRTISESLNTMINAMAPIHMILTHTKAQYNSNSKS